MGERDTHCLAGGSLGSFYKHSLKKEKVDTVAFREGCKSTGTGGWKKKSLSVLRVETFGFDVEEFTYSYKLELTIHWLRLFCNVCACVWSKRFMRRCGGTELKCSCYFGQCLA